MPNKRILSGFSYNDQFEYIMHKEIFKFLFCAKGSTKWETFKLLMVDILSKLDDF